MAGQPLPEQFGADVKQLIDSDIRKAIGESKVIFQNSNIYSQDRVKQTSYELTLLDGRNLDFSALTKFDHANADPRKFELAAYNLTGADGSALSVVVNPWQCCLIRTREQIALPDNVQGKVLPRGQLFQKGLIVENTYIDPGFHSSEDRPGVHLMVFNATQRAVTLQTGMPVARLELLRLSKDVASPHGGAAFIGNTEQADEVWPWPSRLTNAAAEAEDALRVRNIGARLIAMDRQIHALNYLIEQVNGLKASNDVYKLFMYWSFPWLIGLALATLHLENYLAGTALTYYEDLRAWINGATIALLGVIIPIVLTYFSDDARNAARRILWRSSSN